MGYSLGGFIFRNVTGAEDEELIDVLDEKYRNVDKVTMQEAPEKSQKAIAIGRPDDMAVVLGLFLPHGCSFEEENLSLLDGRLAAFSTRGDVLCFLMSSYSDTYAYSLFHNGNRVRAMSTSEGQVLSDWGEAEGFERKPAYSEDDVVNVIDRFLGTPLGDLLYDNTMDVYVYYK